MSIFGLFANSYKKRVIQICSKYELPKPVLSYFKSLPYSNDPKIKKIRIKTLESVCGGDTLTRAIRCLNEMMMTSR